MTAPATRCHLTGRVVVTVPGDPVSKPAQKRSDRWRPTPKVLRWRAWADQARLCARPCYPLVPNPSHVEVLVFAPVPASWPAWKRAAVRGQPKPTRPDSSNYLKAAEDALWPEEDAGLVSVACRKFYDDGHGPRVVVSVWP